MKKYFVTGLVLLLPLALTLAIVLFIVNLFTTPFIGIVQQVFHHYGLFQTGFLFLAPEQLQLILAQLLILALLFFFTVLLGMLTRWVIVHYLIRVGDYIFHRIPVVSAIYKTTQDVIKTIFATSTKSFKQVVLVPFPNPETYSMGLVTKEQLTPIKEGERLVGVFVPTTPNPTSGFLMMFQEQDLVYLDMSVEDAFKYIISCGVIATPFNRITKEQAGQRYLSGEEST